jgi:hypothetical protein
MDMDMDANVTAGGVCDGNAGRDSGSGSGSDSDSDSKCPPPLHVSDDLEGEDVIAVMVTRVRHEAKAVIRFHRVGRIVMLDLLRCFGGLARLIPLVVILDHRKDMAIVTYGNECTQRVHDIKIDGMGLLLEHWTPAGIDALSSDYTPFLTDFLNPRTRVGSLEAAIAHSQTLVQIVEVV